MRFARQNRRMDIGVGDAVLDEPAFVALVQRHRRELQVHCYRMLGSFQEAEDLVQETFLRAWRNLDAFAGRSTVRAWLYKIATNACLDALDGRERRVLPFDVEVGGEVGGEIRWLQPIPDRVLEPDTAAVDRETIELVFLAAIQHLPPRQRAVLILRDVLGWPAAEVATALDTGVAAVNSATQRARATMKRLLPERRAEWTAIGPSAAERAVLARYMAAIDAADLGAMAALLAAEVRATMPPYRQWYLVRRPRTSTGSLARPDGPSRRCRPRKYARYELRAAPCEEPPGSRDEPGNVRGHRTSSVSRLYVVVHGVSVLGQSTWPAERMTPRCPARRCSGSACRRLIASF